MGAKYKLVKICSVEEAEEKMEMGICFICDKPFTVEHQLLHHTNIQMIVKEDEEEIDLDSEGFIEQKQNEGPGVTSTEVYSPKIDGVFVAPINCTTQQTLNLTSTILNQKISYSTPIFSDSMLPGNEDTKKTHVEAKVIVDSNSEMKNIARDSSFLTGCNVVPTPSIKEGFTAKPSIDAYSLLQPALQVFDEMSMKKMKATSLNQLATMTASVPVMVRQLKVLLSFDNLKCFDPGGLLSLSFPPTYFVPFLSRTTPSSECPFSSIPSQTSPTITEFQTMQSSPGQASGWPWVPKIIIIQNRYKIFSEMYQNTVQKFSVGRKGLSDTIFLSFSVDRRKSKSIGKACPHHVEEDAWTLSIPLVKNGNIIHNHSARMQFTHGNNRTLSSVPTPPDQYFRWAKAIFQVIHYNFLSKGYDSDCVWMYYDEITKWLLRWMWIYILNFVETNHYPLEDPNYFIQLFDQMSKYLVVVWDAIFSRCRDLESESVSLDLSKDLQRVDIKLVEYTITNMLHWSSLKFFIYGRLINYADIKRRLFVRLYVVNSLNTKCFNVSGVFVAYGLKKFSAIPPRKIILFCNGLVATRQTHFGMEEPSTFCSNFLQELKKIGQMVEGYSYYVIDYFSDDTQLVFCLYNYIHPFILDIKDSSGNLICMDTNVTSMVCIVTSMVWNAVVQLDVASIFKSTTSHNLETHNLFHVLGLKLFTTKYVAAYSSPERSRLVLNQFAFVAVLHRKMINRGSVRHAKVLSKWKALPLKHGTCDC
ncbi:unnamed protein product [Trifolium pratense]|uniref:Uncharacterized protein n=1 Tax=Trifolium pratense TaxID=57577 RepID=A0ACB0I996_TRIPR|nr:unnamed protein product [Trifolium pratense]